MQTLLNSLIAKFEVNPPVSYGEILRYINANIYNTLKSRNIMELISMTPNDPTCDDVEDIQAVIFQHYPTLNLYTSVEKSRILSSNRTSFNVFRDQLSND